MDSVRYKQVGSVDPYGERASSSPTAYYGAGALDLTPTLRIENNRFEDVQLNEHHAITSRPLREGLGSRLLTTLTNAQPAAAALSRSGSVLHSRAKSWAAAYNNINNAIPERSPSPTKNKFIDNLFSGESGPVRLGVPTSPIKEQTEEASVMEYRSSFTERPVRPRMRQQPTSTKVTTTASTGRKSSWFIRKASTPMTPVSPPTTKIEDELLNINLNSALFPPGSDDSGSSPQAFNDLLLNATNLIRRMEAAYKEKVDYLATIQPEIDAQKEENEEVNTRSEHFKVQLETTSRLLQEQREVNEEIINKLAEEKMKVQQLQEERANTIRFVRRDTEVSEPDDHHQKPHRTTKRSSRGSASDSGFESDADTASVFSSGVQTPISQHAPRMSSNLEHRIDLRYVPSRGSALSQQSTAFSRNEGVAWATVEKLRNENSDLRMRLNETQSGYDEISQFVDTLRNTW